MKLLLDANLSWHLVEKLKLLFTDCFHVEKVSLPISATDTEVWQYALEQELIIITNDDDFLHFASVKGFPPKVVLLRTGNQSNDFILSLLIKHKETITALYESDDLGLLELFWALCNNILFLYAKKAVNLYPNLLSTEPVKSIC